MCPWGGGGGGEGPLGPGTLRRRSIFRFVVFSTPLTLYIFLFLTPLKFYMFCCFDSFLTCMFSLAFTSFYVSKRSFRGPGGVGRGLDLGSRAKICVRELASVAFSGAPVASRGPPVTSRWPPVAFRGLPWPRVIFISAPRVCFWGLDSFL